FQSLLHRQLVHDVVRNQLPKLIGAGRVVAWAVLVSQRGCKACYVVSRVIGVREVYLAEPAFKELQLRQAIVVDAPVRYRQSLERIATTCLKATRIAPLVSIQKRLQEHILRV